MSNVLTNKKITTFGDRRVFLARATITGTETETIVTGLKSIENIQITNLTDESTDMVIDVITTPGTISITGLDASDVIDIQAIEFK